MSNRLFTQIIFPVLLVVIFVFSSSRFVVAEENFKDESWDDRDYGTDEVFEEDAFAGITHTCIPRILENTGEIKSSEQGSVIYFELLLSDYCEDKKAYSIKSAWANFSVDKGATWNKVELARKSADPILHTERLNGGVSLSDTNTNGSPIVYFFRAEDSYGNITMELPETDPGWPTDTSKYFKKDWKKDWGQAVIIDKLEDSKGQYKAI